MDEGKRWTVRDRYGNNIYITNERWQHIVEPVNHPEMSEFEILQASPVNEILSLSAYTPSVLETIPITMVHPLPVAAA